MIGLLLRPVRTLLVLGAGFVGGWIVSGQMYSDACIDAGGVVEGGLCRGLR